MTEDNERAWKELIRVSSEWTLRHKEAILAVDLELKSSRERIKELEEVLMDVSVSPGKDPCWCIDFDKSEHDEGCQKARKALGIEVSAT